MKKIITSLCLSFMFIVAAFSDSKANTYYVLDGQEFNLVPVIGNSVFTQILWTVDGVALAPITDNIGKFTKTFSLGTGAAEKLLPVEHIIKLGVLSDALGCVSDVLTHTIVVLPKVTLSISTPADTFCEGLVTGTLTVSADVDLDLLKTKYNVTLTPFGWNGGSTGNTLAITQAGTYTVGADYFVLPSGSQIVGALVPTATKIIGTGAVASATKVIKTVAKPIAPDLTFN